MHRSLPLLAVVALLLTPHQLPAQADPLAGLDEWIEREMQVWEIPGLAVGVVRNDSVVYARGFGVLGLDDPRPVDEHTLFGVASTTKAMTAAALGMLVDEGRLGWDDRVVDHLPWFALDDPWVTREVRIRDLLTHRVGVGRMTGNRIQYMPNRLREEIIRRMRFHEPEAPFRHYVYSNVMYSVAGEVIPAVTGQSWDAFVRERIFAPLGMARSNTTVDDISEGENAAWPHQEIEGRVRAIPRRNFDNVAASAAVNTSVREMAEWMRLQLGEPGVHNGNRLISEATMREMHRGQIALGGGTLDAGRVSAYGLGWRLDEYEGRRTSSHGGATDGMNTTLVLVPEEDLGVVVVTNTFNNLMGAIANRVVDAHLGVPERDWGRLFREGYERRYAAAQARRDSIEAQRTPGTSPTHPLERYVGSYADSLYDTAEIRMGSAGLEVRFWEDETQVADLEHWHHDTFRAHWRNPAQREKFVWFTLGQDGEVDALKVQWTLRPVLLQVGIYPTDYYRITRFARVE